MALSRLQIEKNPDKFPEFFELSPNIIGFYSIDKDGYNSTAKHLKYLRPNYREWFRSNRNFNLKSGKETYIRKSMNEGGSDDKIDFILRWISENTFLRKISEENTNQEFYFIGLRGLYKTIMKTPFLEDSWFIDAVKVKNIIFLCVFRTEDEKQSNQKFRPTEYYGQKFEQCMRTDDPADEPNLQTPVNANEDFCLVYQTKINGHNLIYGGETDAMEWDHKLTADVDVLNRDPSSFVELKTSYIGIRNQQKFKLINLLNCWTQTYLSGIENIYWGFQNGNGQLCEIKLYKTYGIPNQAQNIWSPRVSQGFLGEFLDFVKTTMQDERDMTYYRFSRDTTNLNSPDFNFVVATKKKFSDCKIIPDRFKTEVEMFSKAFE